MLVHCCILLDFSVWILLTALIKTVLLTKYVTKYTFNYMVLWEFMRYNWIKIRLRRALVAMCDNWRHSMFEKYFLRDCPNRRTIWIWQVLQQNLDITGIVTEFGYDRYCNTIWIWQLLQQNLTRNVITYIKI